MKEALKRDLIACKAVSFGQFALASGQTSNYYVDLRKAVCEPYTLLAIAGFLNQIRPARFDHWAGVELGAVPLAVACAIKSGYSYLIVRKEAKEHGTNKLIEGTFYEGQHVVLVEDVVTTGGSSMRAIKKLQDAGLIVQCVLAVIDREQGGREAFEEAQIPFRALLTKTELLEGINV